MSLRDRHEEFLAISIESTGHYGEEILFDVSSVRLRWHLDYEGDTAVERFALNGIVNIVSDQDRGERGMAGVSVSKSNVTVRLSSLLDICGGVPAEGTQVTIETQQGPENYVVEDGQTAVDHQLGRVHYYLTRLADIA